MRAGPVAFLLVASCSREPSEVYIPAPDFTQALSIATAQGPRAGIRVGEPLRLHAARRTGPWIRVARASLPENACWLAVSPPDFEREVAATVRWHVEPPHQATFNGGLRPDGTREVVFAAPGTYRLTAVSASWCGEPFGGDTLAVEVDAAAD